MPEDAEWWTDLNATLANLGLEPANDDYPPLVRPVVANHDDLLDYLEAARAVRAEIIEQRCATWVRYQVRKIQETGSKRAYFDDKLDDREVDDEADLDDLERPIATPPLVVTPALGVDLVSVDEPATITPTTSPARTPRRVRKFPKKRRRRSYTRSRKAVTILEGYVRDSRPAPVTTPTTLETDPISTRRSYTGPTPIETLETTKKTGRRADTRRAPAWRYTTEIEQTACYTRTVSATGGGLSFTLNLGGKVLKAANDNPAKFKTWMHDRIEKALKASPLGFRDFWFAIECTPTGRVHLHGAIDAKANEHEPVREALEQAGGVWTPRRPGELQAHTDVMFCRDGWSRYTRKAKAFTKRLLGVKSIISVTRGCRARGEALWEASRKAARAHRGPVEPVASVACVMAIGSGP